MESEDFYLSKQISVLENKIDSLSLIIASLMIGKTVEFHPMVSYYNVKRKKDDPSLGCGTGLVIKNNNGRLSILSNGKEFERHFDEVMILNHLVN